MFEHPRRRLQNKKKKKKKKRRTTAAGERKKATWSSSSPGEEETHFLSLLNNNNNKRTITINKNKSKERCERSDGVCSSLCARLFVCVALKRARARAKAFRVKKK